MQAGQVGEQFPVPGGQLLPVEAPLPVSGPDAWLIHAMVRIEAKDVLHGNDRD